MAFKPTDDQKKVVERVSTFFHDCENGGHRQFRDRCDRYYKLYRSDRNLRRDIAGAGSDRDTAVRDAQSTWGSQMWVPIGFQTIETMVPRVLSNRPKLLLLPRDRVADENIEAMKAVLDSQMEQAHYEVKLHPTVKTGLMYGLGIQKLAWRYSAGTRKQLQRGTGTAWVEGTASRTAYDDWDVWDVDPRDFFWDRLATSMLDCTRVIHRTWRDTDYVKGKLERQEWGGISVEDAMKLGPSGDYGTQWAARMDAQGLPSKGSGGSQPHEVWEFHDGTEIITVLDRQVPVSRIDNPFWHGELPFHIYRPTIVPSEFAGISELEPIEDLIDELNTLRRQRRDNAALALQRPIAFYNGLVDPEALKMGPGVGIPVDGNPSDLLYPIQIPDIPGSSYQEENAITGDIERTTGLSDPVSGIGDASATATGVQLVQAAANVRIALKTRIAETELIAPECQQALALNQQKITGNREVPVPFEPKFGEPDSRWAWLQVSPAELQGEWLVRCEGGTIAPENVPQMRQDAQIYAQLMTNPAFDASKVATLLMQKMGVQNPGNFVAPSQVIPPQFIDIVAQELIAQGAKPDGVQQLMATALQQAQAGEQAQGQQQPQQGQQQQQPQAA